MPSTLVLYLEITLAIGQFAKCLKFVTTKLFSKIRKTMHICTVFYNKISFFAVFEVSISQKSNSSIFHLMPLVRKCNVVYEIVNVISAAGHQKSHSLRVKWQQTTQFLDVIVTDLSGVLEILACHSSFQKERGQLWYVPAWGIDDFLHNHPHHFLEF